MIKCLLSRPGLIAGPLHSTPLQNNSKSIPRLDPIDSKSSVTLEPSNFRSIQGTWGLKPNSTLELQWLVQVTLTSEDISLTLMFCLANAHMAICVLCLAVTFCDYHLFLI